jgi:opacity protein-like surface antigen
MPRSKKTTITRLSLCAVLLMCSATLALAQQPNKNEYPKFEVFAGFSALGEGGGKGIRFGGFGVGGGYATPTGSEVSAIRNFTRHIGLKADFSAHFKNDSNTGPLTLCTPTCTTATQAFQIKTRVYNLLVGPEFKARNSTRLTPFAHVLGGAAHTTASFTTSGAPFNLFLRRNDTAFAMAIGGGVDIRATDRVSFRAQMDYNPVFISNSGGGGRRDLARISLGVLFH